jgi:hypothetical protein
MYKKIKKKMFILSQFQKNTLLREFKSASGISSRVRVV